MEVVVPVTVFVVEVVFLVAVGAEVSSPSLVVVLLVLVADVMVIVDVLFVGLLGVVVLGNIDVLVVVVVLVVDVFRSVMILFIAVVNASVDGRVVIGGMLVNI